MILSILIGAMMAVDTSFPIKVILNNDTAYCYTYRHNEQILQTYILVDHYKEYVDSIQKLKTDEVVVYQTIIKDKNEEISRYIKIEELRNRQLSLMSSENNRLFNELKTCINDKPRGFNWKALSIAGLAGLVFGMALSK